jgi:hypothetical protein
MYMTRLSVASGHATETQDTGVCIMHLPKILGGLLNTYLYTPHERMKSVGSHGSSSQLFVNKVMV